MFSSRRLCHDLPMNLHPISEGRVHESLKWLEEIRDSRARPSGFGSDRTAPRKKHAAHLPTKKEETR